MDVVKTEELVARCLNTAPDDRAGVERIADFLSEEFPEMFWLPGLVALSVRAEVEDQEGILLEIRRKGLMVLEEQVNLDMVKMVVPVTVGMEDQA